MRHGESDLRSAVSGPVVQSAQSLDRARRIPSHAPADPLMADPRPPVSARVAAGGRLLAAGSAGLALGARALLNPPSAGHEYGSPGQNPRRWSPRPRGRRTGCDVPPGVARSTTPPTASTPVEPVAARFRLWRHVPCCPTGERRESGRSSPTTPAGITSQPDTDLPRPRTQETRTPGRRTCTPSNRRSTTHGQVRHDHDHSRLSERRRLGRSVVAAVSLHFAKLAAPDGYSACRQLRSKELRASRDRRVPDGYATGGGRRPKVTALRTSWGVRCASCRSGRAPRAPLTVENAILMAIQVVASKISLSLSPAWRSRSTSARFVAFGSRTS